MYQLPTPRFSPVPPSPIMNELIAQKQEHLEGLCSEQILKWTFDTFGSQVAFAPSWNQEDVVVYNFCEKSSQRIRTADRIHGLLLPETWESPEPHEIGVHTFDGRKASAGLWARFHMEHLCKIHEKLIGGYRAWIVSARREQDPALENMPILSWNERFGILRVAPLARWRKESVRRKIRQYDTTSPGTFSDRPENENVYFNSVMDTEKNCMSYLQPVCR